MHKTCKGCGARLQNEDKTKVGYVPDLSQDYCQRCYRIRYYGDVTIDMSKGIDSSQTLNKINELEGTVFWVVDLFDLESNLISRLNRKIPDRDIVLILTKRDVLPKTLSDGKIKNYMMERLSEEGIEVRDIIIAGHLQKQDAKTDNVINKIKAAMKKYGKNGNIIFMGAANAGKSTLINRLFTDADLTVSRNPGTTLDVVEMELDGQRVFDTPGIENRGSLLSWISGDVLKTVIPQNPIRPYVSQIFEDQSFAAGGLARMDVYCDGKATVTGYFSQALPIHRGKVSNADALWDRHLGTMLSPTLDKSPDTMAVFQGPKLKKGQKMDVVIQGLGWFCLSGDIQNVIVQVHKGIQVSFRKAMI